MQVAITKIHYIRAQFDDRFTQESFLSKIQNGTPSTSSIYRKVKLKDRAKNVHEKVTWYFNKNTPTIDFLFIPQSTVRFTSKIPIFATTSLITLKYIIEIASERRKRTRLYDKRDYFNFPIVNFSFICSKIPAASAYGVYISQLIRYSRACGNIRISLIEGCC
jgi:hypothetical protein